MEQTLDAEYYWLLTYMRWQLQKRTQSGKTKPNDSDYDDLKAVALIEREEQLQVWVSLFRYVDRKSRL